MEIRKLSFGRLLSATGDSLFVVGATLAVGVILMECCREHPWHSCCDDVDPDIAGCGSNPDHTFVIFLVSLILGLFNWGIISGAVDISPCFSQGLSQIQKAKSRPGFC